MVEPKSGRDHDDYYWTSIIWVAIIGAYSHILTPSFTALHPAVYWGILPYRHIRIYGCHPSGSHKMMISLY